jgi:hypothetical protein
MGDQYEAGPADLNKLTVRRSRLCHIWVKLGFMLLPHYCG